MELPYSFNFVSIFKNIVLVCCFMTNMLIFLYYMQYMPFELFDLKLFDQIIIRFERKICSLYNPRHKAYMVVAWKRSNVTYNASVIYRNARKKTEILYIVRGKIFYTSKEMNIFKGCKKAISLALINDHEKKKKSYFTRRSFNKVESCTRISLLYPKICYKSIFLTLCLLEDYHSYTLLQQIFCYIWVCYIEVWVYIITKHIGIPSGEELSVPQYLFKMCGRSYCNDSRLY